ncbi:carboxylate-amine ligase [Actinacidiphila yeochonensis]|uniref:carboxylate-amine ligase n=1 Tax=Actinacidiphila yeochonensis TaxID=89050 RepID=UPI0007C6E66C|nr:glutamate--cysteine ligase [Actinacidiphila yeochonensis]
MESAGAGPPMGVEEEYVLLGPGGLPEPGSARVRAVAEREPALARGEVDSELLQAQVEVATPVCAGLDEVAAHLARLRRGVVAAAGPGCRVASTGSAPFAPDEAVPVTPDRRYREMRTAAARLVDEQLINGMHVHVAVPDRAAGASCLGRLRRWLPVLIALGANSPFWAGRDTGFASWRTIVFGRWPAGGSPPFTAGAEDYERQVGELLATGVVADRKQLYWHARLSETYPTLEIRAPDVQLDVRSAVTLAGLARGLVVTALGEVERAVPVRDPADAVLRAAGWRAARHGLADVLVDPRGGTPAPAREVVGALLEHVAPALRAQGDLERVTAGVGELLDGGAGADRQRASVSAGGVDGLLDLIAPPPPRDPAASRRGAARRPPPGYPAGGG